MSLYRGSPVTPTIVYWRHASMSRARRCVSSPAHRPTWLSNPSAPITTSARTSNTSLMCSHRAPTTRSPSRSKSTALVLMRISAPAFAASFARWRSNRSRSRTYPHSFPAQVSSTIRAVPSGARIRAPSTSWRMNSPFGDSPISSSQRFATPSPQRTGVPISDRFSIRRTSTPALAANFAAVLPVGPAPTTRTSTARSIGRRNRGRLMRLLDFARGAPTNRLGPSSYMQDRPSWERRTYLLRSTHIESMELESRKVQKLGYSSLGVSVPKAWAESNGIRPGTVVNMVVEDDGSLRVRVGPLEEYPSPAEATIDADAWTGPESLTRLITGNYIVGCNTIRIRSREELTPGRLQEIHEAVRGLTGLTIVNQGPRFVTIENFVEPTRFPIDGFLRRLHYLTSRMEKLVLGVLAGESGGRIDEVGRMEVEVDRLYWLVVRQLLLGAQTRSIAARIGVTEPRHLLGDRVVSVSLENLGDLWEELAAEIAGEHRR